jgi:hypothetical protein
LVVLWSRRDDNFKIFLEEIRREVVDWTGSYGGLCEQGNQVSGFIKGGKFLDDYQLSKQNLNHVIRNLSFFFFFFFLSKRDEFYRVAPYQYA